MRVQLTVPPNTPISAPIGSGIVPILHGMVISRELIIIPEGHAYLTGVQIFNGREFAPAIPEPGSPTLWISGDGVTIEKNIRIVLTPPYIYVRILGYNLDDTNPHTFYVDLD